MLRSIDKPEKWRKECFNHLIQDLNDAIEARASWWTDFRRSINNYRCIPPGAKHFPWPNCSNLIPPMTTNLVEDTVRRIAMYFVQSREYITLTGMKKSADTLGSASRVQEFLRWQADAELNYMHFTDAFVRYFVAGGTAFAMTDWAYEKSVVADVVMLGRNLLQRDRADGQLRQVQVGEPARRTTPIEKVFQEVFASQGLRPLGDYKKLSSPKAAADQYQVMYEDEKTKKQKAIVTVDRSEELGDDIEVIAEMPRVICNQPVIHALSPERIIVPPGDHTIHTAPFVGLKSWVSWEQVQQHWKSGYWRSDESEKTKLRQMFEAKTAQENEIRERGGEDWGSLEERGARDDQDRYLGVDSTRFRRRQIPIVTVWRRWPILKDESQRPEAAITILPKHNMIVRIQHGSVESAAGIGKRPFIAHHFVRSMDEFYGASLPRIVEPYQEELNAVSNMQIDALNVTSNPVIFLDHTATFSRDRSAYHPGATIKVSQPQQNVMIPQWPSRLGEFEVQIQRLNAYGQQLANQTPTPPDVSGANRTARGAQLLVTERNFNVVYDARMVGPAIEDLWQQIHSWNARNMPPEKEIAVMGENDIAQPFVVRREEVRAKYLFRFEAGQAVMNDVIRMERFTEAFQLTAPIAQAPSEQVPRPLWNMAVEIWKQRGVKDPERFLPQPSDYLGTPLSPDVEHEIFKMGRPVSVHPSDIDVVHRDAHLAFAATPEFNRLPPEIIEAFGQHVLLHQRRIAAAAAATQGAGQSSIGSTGVSLGGRLGLQGNPLVNAGQGQPATTQPQAPGSPVSVL